MGWIQQIGKLGFVNGACKRETQRNDLKVLWDKCDAIVHSWIMNSVSKHLLNGIVYGSNAHAVWEDLKERFNKVNRMRIFQLHKEIATMSQGTDSVSIYHSKLKELWDEYDMIVPVPSCGCDKSKDYVEHLQEQRLLQFLSGLNDSYDHTRRQILLKTVAPSVNQAYAMIIEVESDKSIGVNSLKQLDPLAINFGRGRGHAYQGFTGRGQPYQQLSGVEVDNNYC